MNQSGILSPFWQQVLKDQGTVDFHPTPSDSTHFIVSRLLVDGRETIGHVYVEFEGDDFRYISTNRKGKEIFPPTTDFNLVERQFEQYAQQLALQQKAREYSRQYKFLNHNLNLKNMNTQSQNTAQKPQKKNQLRFIEYEKPAGDGHFITVGDSYHNVIGRVHKSYNEAEKKYEYVAFDHAGNLMTKSNLLWEVKNEFVKNREQLLEQAHQRRIVSKQQSRETTKGDERKAEIQKMREDKTDRTKETDKGIEDETGKSGNKSGDRENENSSQQEEREQELRDIRDSQDDDRGDMDIDR